MRNATINGNDCAVYINGTLFAIASNFRYTVNSGTRAIHGIDSVFPFELASGTHSVSGDMSVYRKHNTAGIEGVGIAPRDAYLPRSRYFSVTVIDRSTDTIIFKCDKCAITSQSWTVPAQGVITGDFSFMGIGYSNEF